MLKSLKNFGTLYLIVFGALWLIRYPVAECFDCEVANAWGQNDHITHERAIAFLVLFISSSFSAGLFQIRLGWLVPIALTIADVLTMHIAGVEWWSIRNNEGPIVFFADLLIGTFALAIGLGINWLTTRLKSRQPTSPSLE